VPAKEQTPVKQRTLLRSLSETSDAILHTVRESGRGAGCFLRELREAAGGEFRGVGRSESSSRAADWRAGGGSSGEFIAAHGCDALLHSDGGLDCGGGGAVGAEIQGRQDRTISCISGTLPLCCVVGESVGSAPDCERDAGPSAAHRPPPGRNFIGGFYLHADQGEPQRTVRSSHHRGARAKVCSRTIAAAGGCLFPQRTR
jgi:hypothetical protein